MAGESPTSAPKEGFLLEGFDSAENNEFFSTVENMFRNSFKTIRRRHNFFAESNEVLTRELAEDGYSWFNFHSSFYGMCGQQRFLKSRRNHGWPLI
ncbi:hypothetical protein P8452_74619 [Trifolium repens]|nr:hypothetical protein P8452_74619 [Trifolium repens]